MQPPPHHATFEGYHTSPFAPIPLNSSLGCIWCAPDSIVLYMATKFGWNHLNWSLLYHHPKMSSLFCRLCLISEQISPLYPSTSALTAFNTLELSSLMSRRTRGATCGRWHHPNLKRRVCPGTLARTCKSTSWDQCSIFSNQKTPASSTDTSKSSGKRRSRSFDSDAVQLSWSPRHLGRIFMLWAPCAFQTSKRYRRRCAASGFPRFALADIVPRRNEPDPRGRAKLLRREYATKGKGTANWYEWKFVVVAPRKKMAWSLSFLFYVRRNDAQY